MMPTRTSALKVSMKHCLTQHAGELGEGQSPEWVSRRGGGAIQVHDGPELKGLLAEKYGPRLLALTGMRVMMRVTPPARPPPTRGGAAGAPASAAAQAQRMPPPASRTELGPLHARARTPPHGPLEINQPRQVSQRQVTRSRRSPGSDLH